MNRLLTAALLGLAVSPAHAISPSESCETRFEELRRAMAEIEPVMMEVRAFRNEEESAEDVDTLIPRRNVLLPKLAHLKTALGKKGETYGAGNTQLLFAHGALMAHQAETGQKVDAGEQMGDYIKCHEKELQVWALDDKLKLELEEEERVFLNAKARSIAAKRGRALFRGLAGGGVLVALLALAAVMRARQLRRPQVLATPAPVPAPLPAPASPARPAFRVLRDEGPSPYGPVAVAADPEGRPVLLARLDALPGGPARGPCLAALRAAAALRHPYLAPASVLEERGAVLMVTGRPGSSLRSVLDAGPPAAAWCLTVLRQVAEAVDFVHGKGVVHGGLVPEAIRIGEDGIARVAHLGLAPALRAAEGVGARALCVPAYSAPEQDRGKDRYESDVYSLGVILYEMAAGSTPYPGPNFSAQKSERRYRPAGAACRGWPPGLDAAVARALDPDPARRPRSCRELVSALAG